MVFTAPVQDGVWLLGVDNMSCAGERLKNVVHVRYRTHGQVLFLFIVIETGAANENIDALLLEFLKRPNSRGSLQREKNTSVVEQDCCRNRFCFFYRVDKSFHENAAEFLISRSHQIACDTNDMMTWWGRGCTVGGFIGVGHLRLPTGHENPNLPFVDRGFQLGSIIAEKSLHVLTSRIVIQKDLHLVPQCEILEYFFRGNERFGTKQSSGIDSFHDFSSPEYSEHSKYIDLPNVLFSYYLTFRTVSGSYRFGRRTITSHISTISCLSFSEWTMKEQLRWGILGAGSIANLVGNGILSSKTNRVQAVASRDREKAAAFASKHTECVAYGSYEDLLADPSVDLVYITTPHPLHERWAVQALEAGKNVLCEKPVAMTRDAADRILRVAAQKNVFFMEAFMYRCHPQTQKVYELISDGAIGDVRLIKATFSFHARFREESRLYCKELGGGGILDVGCYCSSFSRLIAGAALGKPFADPIEVFGAGHVGSSGVDEYSSALVKFDNDILGHLSCGIALAQDHLVEILGTDGSLRLSQPWNPSPNGEDAVIDLMLRRNKKAEQVVIQDGRGTYTIEADEVARSIFQGKSEYPFMTWDDTRGNMAVLDSWRAQVGVTY